MRFCHSCAAPLDNPEFRGAAEDYCKYCTDEEGRLKSRDQIKEGVIQWLKAWQPRLDDETARKRAEHYMKSMPAWADD